MYPTFILLHRYENIAEAELEDTPNKQNGEMNRTFLDVLRAKQGICWKTFYLKFAWTLEH